MAHEYFSDKELGPKERTIDSISQDVWQGLVRVMKNSIEQGEFGDEFPEECPDGRGTIGTSIEQMGIALKAELPNAMWPLDPSIVPELYLILDLLEFCHLHIAKTIEGTFHSFFDHYHLSFDKKTGQANFREKINRILSRNGIAFEMGSDGRIRRLAPPILRERLIISIFVTGDPTLDQMLDDARSKFLSPTPSIREESLKSLWSAWERLKTVNDPQNKKTSIASLLDIACQEPVFRSKLDAEAKELTHIGNSFLIRHSEVTQTPLQRIEHVDYLFHRLFAMIYMLLSTRDRMRRTDGTIKVEDIPF